MLGRTAAIEAIFIPLTSLPPAESSSEAPEREVIVKKI
jgi:hypothetical protein